MFNSLPSQEQEEGSHAHLKGMHSQSRFQESYHGGNPMGVARKIVGILMLIERNYMSGSVLNALPTTAHVTLAVLSGVFLFL